MIKSEYLILVACMGLVTFLPRWIPLHFLSKRKLPDKLVQWLDMIPVAILSALLVPILVTSGEPRQLDIFQPKLLVALPTFLFAWKTKSLGGTVIVGMFLYWLCESML